MKRPEHFDALEIMSYGAIFNFINSNRNYGKTWCFKKRAFRRGLKYGKITLWVRRFQTEAKETAENFYKSRDLQKFCGIELYDPETKRGNVRQDGRSFYVKRGNKWKLFLKVVYLSQATAIRGVDDVDLDTIVFDEYRTTQEKYRQYRGNEVDHFNDIFITVKREHKVRCFFLGNKEEALNPYAHYFGLPELPDSYEGIKTYRNGSIAVQQINNVPKELSDYDRSLRDLYNGTRYGNYLYESKTKSAQDIRIKRAPKDATIYVQLFLRGHYVRILLAGGCFYIVNTVDKTQPVYCDIQINQPKHLLLSKKHKRFFNAFVNGLIDGRVYYNTQGTLEAITPFLQWLNI